MDIALALKEIIYILYFFYSIASILLYAHLWLVLTISTKAYLLCSIEVCHLEQRCDKEYGNNGWTMGHHWACEDEVICFGGAYAEATMGDSEE